VTLKPGLAETQGQCIRWIAYDFTVMFYVTLALACTIS